MKQFPLISIIVPVYNVERYLAKCVDSLLVQTYSSIEILLIDDGSTDQSGRMCDQYLTMDSRIRVFHKPNGGLSDARNYGLERAKGEFVVFVDSDDWVLPDALKIWYQCISARQADVCISDLSRYEQGHVTPYPFLEVPSVATQYPLRLFLLRSSCGKMYRRKFLEEHQLRFVKGLKFEDAAFWYHLLKMNPVISSVPECPYVYRQREGSIVHTYDYRDLPQEYSGMLRVIKQLHSQQALQSYWTAVLLKSVQFFVLSQARYRRRFFLKIKALLCQIDTLPHNPHYGEGLNGLCKYIFYLWRNTPYFIVFMGLLPFWYLKCQYFRMTIKRKHLVDKL